MCAAPSTVEAAPAFALPPLSREQLRVVERVAELAGERFAQRAAEYDEESKFPSENFQDLREGVWSRSARLRDRSRLQIPAPPA